MCNMLKRFEAFRIPIVKQEVHKAESGLREIPIAHIANSLKDATKTEISCDGLEEYVSGNYRVRPLYNVDNGSVLFPFFDQISNEIVTCDRRVMSDEFIRFVENL